MKNKLKSIYLFYTNFFDTIVSLLSVLFFSSLCCNQSIKKCRKTHKKHNECIVMGNGPSLTSLFENNIDEIFEKDIFAVNFFCLTKYFKLVKPSCYVLLDQLIFNPASDEEIILTNDLISKFNDISWQMVLFIPVKFKYSQLLKKIANQKLNIVFFNATPINGITNIENFLFKRNLGMPTPETVINATIFLAINMDFNVIHLYGVEQSWLKYLSVRNDNKISVGLNHFYGGSDKTDEYRTLSEFLLSQVVVFKSHKRLQEYAKHKEKRILNHTHGSYIDAYERVILERPNF